MKKTNGSIVANFKLTNKQLDQIRKYLPYGFFTALGEKHDGITLRQMKEVMAQRTTNAEHNEIVWKSIKKRLTMAGRKDLVELVDSRLSFCQNLLLV